MQQFAVKIPINSDNFPIINFPVKVFVIYAAFKVEETGVGVEEAMMGSGRARRRAVDGAGEEWEDPSPWDPLLLLALNRSYRGSRYVGPLWLELGKLLAGC